jgi:8-oxo-dGTP diphosphatase
MNDAAANPRLYPDRPYVGVGVVIFRGEEVLLAQRGKLPRRYDWSIPGGAQELGETVFQAGAREILEETGLTVEILGLVDVIDAISHDDDGRVMFHYTLVDLVAEWRAGEAAPDDDVAAVQWVHLDALDGVEMRQVTRDVIREAHLKRGKFGARTGRGRSF